MALTKTDVSALYVAIFNRASEGEGNTFWQTAGTSAEVANAMLETAPAKEYFGAALDDDQAFVEHIYLNTLGKTLADDAEGIEFWVEQLATQSRGDVIARLIESALDEAHEGTDAQNLFLNMVAVSDYTADTLEEAPDDLDALRFDAGLEGVTADPASVDAAKQAVDEILNPVDPVVKALNELDAANQDKDAFLKAAAVLLAQQENPNVDPETVPALTDAQVALLPQGAAVAVAAALNGIANNSGEDDFEAVPAGFAGLSRAVQDAYLADGQAAAAALLEEAQDDVAAAQKKVAEKAGLASAIQNYQNAVVAFDLAEDNEEAAELALEAEKAKFNAFSYEIGSPAEPLTADDAITDDGELATGVTVAKYPAVADLLAAWQADAAADLALGNADAVLTAATKQVNLLDPNLGANEDTSLALAWQAVGAKIDVPAGAAEVEYPTQNQIAKQLDTLNKAIVLGANQKLEALGEEGQVQIVEGETPLDPQPATVDAYNDFVGLVNELNDELSEDPAGPLVVELTEALDAVSNAAKTGIQDLIAKLDAAVAAKAMADLAVATLAEKNEAIEAAEAVFEDLGLALPITLGAGLNLATSEADLFLLGNSNATVSGFAADDSIYLKNEYKLVELGANQNIDQRVGESAELEIFFKQSSTGTTLFVEKQAFAGNALGQADIVTITLNGVTGDLALEDGFLSIA